MATIEVTAVVPEVSGVAVVGVPGGGVAEPARSETSGFGASGSGTAGAWTVAVQETVVPPRARVKLIPGLLQPRLVSKHGTEVHVALVAGGATLLGGDSVDIRIRVGAGCTLRVEDVGGTVAYPSTGTPSTWNVDVEVADGGRLVWESYPFVVTQGADVLRSTRVVLGSEAVACMRETLVLGRTGEAGGRIRTATRVHSASGTPIFVEDLDLDGTDPQPGILGSASVFDNALLLGKRPAASPSPGAPAEAAVGSGAGAAAGGASSPAGTVRVLELAAPGAIARAMGTETHASHVDGVWREWVAGVSPASR